MLEKKQVYKAIDDLMEFKFSFMDEDVYISNICSNSADYHLKVKQKLKYIQTLLNELYKISNFQLRTETLQEILTYINSKPIVEIDLTKYPYDVQPAYFVNGEEIEPAMILWPAHYHLEEIYKFYKTVKDILLDVFNSSIIKNGFAIEDGVNIIPVPTEKQIPARTPMRQDFETDQLKGTNKSNSSGKPPLKIKSTHVGINNCNIENLCSELIQSGFLDSLNAELFKGLLLGESLEKEITWNARATSVSELIHHLSKYLVGDPSWLQFETKFNIEGWSGNKLQSCFKPKRKGKNDPDSSIKIIVHKAFKIK